MKRITINVPDTKYTFFMELLQNLGFDNAEEFVMPEEYKSIVSERIRTTKPEDLVHWQEARKQLHFENKPQL